MKPVVRLVAGSLLVSALVLGYSSPVAAANGDMYFGYKAGSVTWSPTSGYSTIAGLSLPAGTFWLTITASLNGGIDETTGTGRVICRLAADSFQLDWAAFELDANTNPASLKSLYLTGLWGSSSAWHANLQCAAPGREQNISIEDIRISAMRGYQSGTNTPQLRATYLPSTVTVAGDSAFHTVTTLDVPQGKWLVTGKASLRINSSAGASDVTCRLQLSTDDKDAGAESLTQADTRGSEGEIAIQAAHNFSSATTVKLQCKSNRSFVTDAAPMVAVKAGTLKRTPLGGSTSSTGSAAPTVTTAYKAASIAIPTGTFQTVGTVDVPNGWWQVQAKATLNATDIVVECNLMVSDVRGHARIRGGVAAGHTGIYLQDAGIESSGIFTVRLQCKAASAGATLTNLRITAVSTKPITYQSL